MKFLRHLFSGMALCVAMVGTGGMALAAEKQCSDCHGDDETVLPMFQTKHGTQTDSRAPSCMSCHGESQAHKKAPSRAKPDRTFDKKTETSVADRNDACQSCHAKDSQRSHWSGSAHDTRELACNTCHRVHSGKDKVRDKQTQAEFCYSCHKEQRAQLNKPSHHPVPEGKMTCSDCHNVHGSVGPKLMKRDSVVETCYTCHLEKRGPFVHNHEPVQDDCGNCHNPHGTTVESMLKMRPPFLCQSCHTPHAALQPQLKTSPVTPGNTVAGWTGNTILQGRSCLNCHTQVHGSNNPTTTPQFQFR